MPQLSPTYGVVIFMASLFLLGFSLLMMSTGPKNKFGSTKIKSSKKPEKLVAPKYD